MTFETEETKTEFTETQEMEVDDGIGCCLERTCSKKPTRFGFIKFGSLEMVLNLCDDHAVRFDTRTNMKNFDLTAKRLDERWDNDQQKFIIPCKDNDGVHFEFYCIWCGREHLHGRGEGHRVAHCDKGSPYKEDGYYLVKETKDQPHIDACLD